MYCETCGREMSGNYVTCSDECERAYNEKLEDDYVRAMEAAALDY